MEVDKDRFHDIEIVCSATNVSIAEAAMNDPIQPTGMSARRKIAIVGSLVLAVPIAVVIWLITPNSHQLSAKSSQTAGAKNSAAKSATEMKTEKTSEHQPDGKTVVVAPVEKPNPDEMHRQLIIGKWETERSGQRVLTVSSDGTAVIEAEINGFAKRLMFGKEMRIDLNWEIEDGHVFMRCTGGKPQFAITAFTNLYGTDRRQPILNLDNDQLLLKDDADDPDHDYKRISE